MMLISCQRSRCQTSRSAVTQHLTHWSSMLSWLHCHHRGWTCVICQRMSSISHQASRHQVRHLTSRGSWRPRISAFGSSSMMPEFKLYQQHHVLQVPHVKESSDQLNWKLHQSLQDSIYHMIYLAVAHCIQHGSPASSAGLTTVYTITPLLGSSGGPSEFMSTHVLYYESVSISDGFVSQTLSLIIHHRMLLVSTSAFMRS